MRCPTFILDDLIRQNFSDHIAVKVNTQKAL